MQQQELSGIIRGCIDRDARCQRRLFDHFAPGLLKTCLLYARDEGEAGDMLQEAFIKIFWAIAQHDPEKGSLLAWMRRITVNAAINYHRKHHRFSFQDIGESSLAESGPVYTDADLHAEEIWKLIRALPDGYRMVFVMHAIEGYSHLEIAEVLGISESTSRSQLTHARKQLKFQLMQQEKRTVHEKL